MPRQRSGVEPLADMRERVAAVAGELAGEGEVGELERRQVGPAAAAGRARQAAAGGARAVGEDDAPRVFAAREAERRPRAAHLQVALGCEFHYRSYGHEPSSVDKSTKLGSEVTRNDAFHPISTRFWIQAQARWIQSDRL